MESNYKNIIWVKTPRCAGTALKRFLIQHNCFHDYRDDYFAIEREVEFNKVIGIVANELDCFIDHNKELWGNSYRFTVVRNPFDKFVSAWHHLYEDRPPMGDVIDNLPTMGQDAFHITDTQANIISNKFGHINYQKIIRYEHLQEQLDDVFEMIGLEGETYL